jgi:hypothetical protein
MFVARAAKGIRFENIENAHKVKRVIANGRFFEMDELLNGMPRNQTREEVTASFCFFFEYPR